MTEATGRPQDQGRPHRKRTRKVSEADRSRIERYYDALRSELDASLAELRPVPSGQLQLDGAEKPPDRPSLDKRNQLVRYMAFIVSQLGTDVDAPADDESPGPPPVNGAGTTARRRRVAYE